MCSGVHVIQFGRLLVNFFFPCDFSLLQHGNFCEEKSWLRELCRGGSEWRQYPVCIASSSKPMGDKENSELLQVLSKNCG
jgi:hypothetical protein